jgi:hypothetical protein
MDQPSRPVFFFFVRRESRVSTEMRARGRGISHNDRHTGQQSSEGFGERFALHDFEMQIGRPVATHFRVPGGSEIGLRARRPTAWEFVEANYVTL